MPTKADVLIKDMAEPRVIKGLLATGWLRETRDGDLAPNLPVLNAHAFETLKSLCFVTHADEVRGENGANRKTLVAAEIREALAPNLESEELYDRLFHRTVSGVGLSSPLNKLLDAPSTEPPAWYFKAEKASVVVAGMTLPSMQTVFGITRDPGLLEQYVFNAQHSRAAKQLDTYLQTLTQQAERFPEMEAVILAQMPRLQAFLSRHSGEAVAELTGGNQNRQAIATSKSESLIAEDLEQDRTQAASRAAREVEEAEQAVAAAAEQARRARDRAEVLASSPVRA